MLALDPFLRLTQASFLFFFGAVAVSAFYGGRNPGIVATLFSAGLANYYFLDSQHSWTLSLAGGLRLALFILQGVLISILVGALHTTQAHLRQNFNRLKATEAEVKDLNRVLQHQVNELQALAAAKLASEDRYRLLVESMDEGFCLCEMLLDEDGTPVDYRFLEVNPVFEPLTGLKQPVGKTARELVPNLEDFWFETYGRVALTRESIRFKQRSLPMQRWFDVYAFPVGEPQRHLFGILFTNITAHKVAEQERERFLAVSSDLQVVTSINGYFQWVSPAFERILGWTTNEMTSRPWTEFVHPDDVGESISEADYLFSGRETFAFENRYRHKDGSYRWFLWNAQPYPEEQVIYGVAIDITDRKLAQLNEQFLKELDLRLRQLSDVEEMQWEVVSRLGQYLEVDRSVWDQIDAIAGMVTVKQDWRRQELPSIVGSYRLSDFILPELINLFYAGQPVAVSDVGSYPHTAPFADSFRALNASAFVSIPCLYEGRWIATLTLSSQTVRHWQPSEVALLQEIVARLWSIIEQTRAFQALHQSEERLRIANERFEFAAKAVNCLIYDWDLEFDRIERTDGLTKLFGYSLEEAEPTGQWWADRIHPEDWQSIREQAEFALAKEDHFCAEYRVLNKSNQYVYVLDNCLVVERNQDGQPTRIVGSTIDISDRKQVEQEREQLLARERATREQAEAANRIKDEFLAIVSHELRSPLNPIVGWAKLLRTRQLDEQKTQHALEVIERNAQMQAQLINDLLDVSRILRGKLSLNAVSVNLAFTIQAALDIVRLAAETKSIQISTTLDQVGNVSGDPDRLQQIIWNLLSNAVKFTPQGGRVEVRLESFEFSSLNNKLESSTTHNSQLTAHNSDRYAQITITDTGKGIHPDFLPCVFERFRQEDPATTRQFGGLGLGLALVRYLVELHGGTVQAHSLGEGQGATFTVKLPLMPSSTTSQKVEPLKQPVNLSGIRALVVDDDTNTREFLAFLLELQGIDVVATATAEEAIAILTQFKPDVLLSDIGMPEVDGYMLIRQVRDLPPDQGGQTLAIALTAYAGEINYQRAIAAGFQQHLAKPIDSDELLEAIANLVKPKE